MSAATPSGCEWLTGFEGSAGSGGGAARGSGDLHRRALHASRCASRSAATEWSYQSVPETSIADWLKEHAPEGARIGYDPWLHSRDWVKRGDRGARPPRAPNWSRSTRNPIDAVWADRPEPSQGAADRPARASWPGKSQRRQAPRHRRLAGQAKAPTRRCWRRSIRSPGPSTCAAPTSATRRSRWPSRWSMPTAPPTCSSPARRSATMSAPHLGNGVRLHERDAFEALSGELGGQDGRGRSRAVGRGDHPGAGGGRGDDRRRARPDRAAARDQERRSRSPATRRPRRATGRRSRGSSNGSTRKRRRAGSTR